MLFRSRVHQRQGHRREAETEFKRAIEADSTYLAPRVELASLYMQAERPADAERMLRDEIRLDSLNFAPSNDLGALLLNVGDTSRYAEAEATLRRAARLAPQSPLVAANLGLVYQRLGRPTDAEREYRRAIALNPLNADRYAALGAFYYGENRLTEAEAAFGRGAAVAPRSARLASLLGWTYRMEHRPGDAEREYRRALTLDSLNFARSNQLGLLLLESKRPVEAELLFRRAARLAPQAADSADVADNLGLALRDLNQPVEAERAFRRAIRLDSLSYLWHFHLAQVLADSSRYVEAAGALRRAAGLAPRSAEVAGTLAWMYAKLDQATDTNAEHEYRRAMALDSLDFSWPNQLGLLLVSKGRYEEGQALFQRALHLAPQAADSADVADNLGVAYRKLNQPAAAELEFRRAIRFDSLSRLGPRRSSAGESHDNKRAGAFRRARAVVPRAADAAGERAWLAAKLNRPAYAERAYKPGLALFEGKPTDKGGGEVSHGDRARFADLLPGEKARVVPP